MMTRANPNRSLFYSVSWGLFLLLLSQQAVWATQKGAMLRVQRADQSAVEGELIAVRETKLILIDSFSQGQTIDINDINHIVVDKKAHTWLGVAIGIVLGGVVGVAIAPSPKKVEEIWDIPILVTEEVIGITEYGLAGALAGGLLGGVIGASVGSDSQWAVAKMSPAEREHLLVKLRSKARIKNAT